VNAIVIARGHLVAMNTCISRRTTGYHITWKTEEKEKEKGTMNSAFDAKGLLAELSELALKMEDQVGPLVGESDDYSELQSNIESLVSEIQGHLDQFEMYEKKGLLVEDSPQPGLMAACENCLKVMTTEYTGRVQFCSDLCKDQMEGTTEEFLLLERTTL
jgi:hypothetical protein